ncbi:type II toxin-antitoxin system RelE/ParE family toxin [Deferrisoma camini]|uniref:type II toxin-antitoxin system RelE/ParE family toxin n=1 Tax=Deferrisoma camini TaxID=1035120 RepID=UPI0038B2A55E
MGSDGGRGNERQNGFEQISEFPSMGRQRPELGPAVRSFPVGRYVVFYRLTGDTVEIVRVISAYRDPSVGL